jgi:hypothetical protein
MVLSRKGCMRIRTASSPGLAGAWSGLLSARAFAVAFPTAVTGSNVAFVLILVRGLTWVAKNTIPIVGSRTISAGRHAAA